MNYQESLEYIHCGFFGGTRPGLERVGELLSLLGDPQDSLRFIHIAGTNGKGSVSAMTDSVLRAAGYHTGLYTSPYLERFNERMVCDGREISDGELAELTSYVRPFAESMKDKPTEFELITAVAMLFFARHKCDPVVLEVGMGGRLDATNIIKTPLVSVITGISLDHTAILGDTVEKIAHEKAGIIKPGVPVIFGGGSPEALEVIGTAAKEHGCDFFAVDREKINVTSCDLSGTELEYEGEKVRLGLLGLYQPYNAATAISTVRELRRRGLDIPEEALVKGMAEAKWKGRFEKLSEKDPLFIIDGSHNPEGIAAAIMSIKHYFGGEKVCLLTGVLRDKDHTSMARELSTVADSVFILKPPNPRALEPSLYAKDFEACSVPAKPFDSTEEAVRTAVDYAKSKNIPLIALGSLYMYGEIKSAFLGLK